MKQWLCYILKNKIDKYKNYTYNGATNNFKRRIRQHNGELVGGAKYTKGKGIWEPYCIITGFEDKIATLQAEWRIKRVEGRRRSRKYCRPDGRIKGLNQILKLEKFTSKCKKNICQQNLTIYINEDFKQYLIDIPNNIKVLNLKEFFYTSDVKTNPKVLEPVSDPISVLDPVLDPDSVLESILDPDKGTT